MLGTDNFKSHVHMLADHWEELGGLVPEKAIIDFGPTDVEEGKKFAWVLLLLHRPEKEGRGKGT